MAIVTIFGGTFGDDEALAQNLALTLGYAYIGRDVLAKASRRCAIPEAQLNDILESVRRHCQLARSRGTRGIAQ
ncbi:MAG: hypothetical protein M3N35_00585 [Candidatus Binatota bacterium]|nr:hypothetical protein [Candidatus Binatota bacterium]